ncbi:GNAT family N-acetyltransferase [Actinophytocola glycyrrhizae]|uniref:GNAT family N-acetyltransferase n=1 Tax=Actinophytocola glycyrrhizae TaxID=2044873 RepID=A0ABV9S1K1_9PSEU
MTVDIRRAREDDDARLLEIDFATWTTSVSPAPPPAREERTSFFDDRRNAGDYLVAEVDGKVSGFVLVRQAIPIESHEHVLSINELAVDPAVQGRGIGGALIEAAAADAARRGARKLTLRVLGGNAGARRLYERRGFVVEGVLRGEFLLNGELVDDVLMARHL